MAKNNQKAESFDLACNIAKMITVIPHSKPSVSREDTLAVVKCLDECRLADNSQVHLFEKEVATYIGHDAGIATNSGTNALHLALLSIKHNNRNEVIIPSYACLALLNAIYSAKLKPKVVDIEEDSYNISIREIKKALNNNTKAIIAPHMFGDPIKNVEDIVALGTPVIEDCALSIGASIGTRKVGSFSDLSICSFYATKVMTTGHGGMILSSSKQIINELRDFMLYDNRNEYKHSYNFKLTDFQAALGRTQLARLEEFIAKRRAIARRYDDNFRHIKNIKVLERSKGCIYFRYILEVTDPDKFITEASKMNIQCRKPIFRPLHSYLGLDNVNYPNTEHAHKHCVSIPIFPTLKEHEIEYVITESVKLLH